MAIIDDPSNFFNTVLYSGTGSENARTGVNFQPDWVWIKQRNGSTNQMLTDSVRGATKTLHSQNTDAESTDAQALKSFNSDGFTVGTDTDVNGAGGTGGTYVAWNWKANGQGSSNTDGTINTTYTSVNTTAGFSISKFTGNNTSGATIGHGLGAVPKMIIVKRLDTADQWCVYHQSIGNTKRIKLNSTDTPSTGSGYWNNTTPTSSLFTIGNSSEVNGSNGNYIAYCFAEKQGYSKFGSYTGNGNADGAFVYTGFKPAFVMVKITAGQTDNWIMQDNKINSFNGASSQRLRPNSSGAEFSSSNEIDLLSNGFKTHGADGEINGSGFSYIYMAFAENPFVASNFNAATAR